MFVDYQEFYDTSIIWKYDTKTSEWSKIPLEKNLYKPYFKMDVLNNKAYLSTTEKNEDGEAVLFEDKYAIVEIDLSTGHVTGLEFDSKINNNCIIDVAKRGNDLFVLSSFVKDEKKTVLIYIYDTIHKTYTTIDNVNLRRFQGKIGFSGEDLVVYDGNSSREDESFNNGIDVFDPVKSTWETQNVFSDTKKLNKKVATNINLEDGFLATTKGEFIDGEWVSLWKYSDDTREFRPYDKQFTESYDDSIAIEVVDVYMPQELTRMYRIIRILERWL